MEEEVTLALLFDNLVGLLLEYVNEHTPDYLPLLLRFRDALEFLEEPPACVVAPKVDPAVLPQSLEYLDSFVLPKAPVVDQDGVEPAPDGSVHEDRRNCRVDPPAHGTDDVALGPDLEADGLDELLGVIGHNPVGRGLAYLHHEVREDRRSHG